MRLATMLQEKLLLEQLDKKGFVLGIYPNCNHLLEGMEGASMARVIYDLKNVVQEQSVCAVILSSEVQCCLTLSEMQAVPTSRIISCRPIAEARCFPMNNRKVSCRHLIIGGITPRARQDGKSLLMNISSARDCRS
jgi:hypothetical protein